MPNWKWAAASRRGTAHSQVGDRRQDAYRVLTAHGDFLIAVACDGAGSASHGRSGAAIAARVLSSRAKDWITLHAAIPPPTTIESWVAEIRLMITSAAARIDRMPGDFATTVVMAISDGSFTVTAHIGDGTIVARRSGAGELEDLSWPESGEYAATTFFLTDPVPRLRIGVIDNIQIDRLALLTDGLERLALDFIGRSAHQPFFSGMFTPISSSAVIGCDLPLSCQLAAFLDSDAVNARTDDDKTLILAAFE